MRLGQLMRVLALFAAGLFVFGCVGEERTASDDNHATTDNTTQTSTTGGVDAAALHTGPAHMAMTTGEMQWGPGPASLPAGAQVVVVSGDMTKSGMFIARLKVPAGYRIAPHTHPAAEHVTVISGNFAMGMGDTWDDTQLKDLGQGGVAVMAPGSTHFAMAREESVVQLHGVGPWAINYVNAADDPRTTAQAQ